MIGDDVSMGAPPYWQKIEGHAVVHHLLGLILHTIEEFTYRREWRDGSELALEFRGRVGKHELQGIDLVSLNDASRVRNLDVLIRPHNAVGALIELVRPKMVAFLTKSGEGD